jgi:hypothetical protein
MFKAMYACCIVNVELEFEHGGGGTGAYMVCPLESEFELHPFSSRPLGSTCNMVLILFGSCYSGERT